MSLQNKLKIGYGCTNWLHDLNIQWWIIPFKKSLLKGWVHFWASSSHSKTWLCPSMSRIIVCFSGFVIISTINLFCPLFDVFKDLFLSSAFGFIDSIYLWIFCCICIVFFFLSLLNVTCQSEAAPWEVWIAARQGLPVARLLPCSFVPAGPYAIPYTEHSPKASPGRLRKDTLTLFKKCICPCKSSIYTTWCLPDHFLCSL